MKVAASILTPWNSAWSTSDSLYKFYVSHHGGNHDNKPTEKANYFLLLKRTIITSRSKIWCRTNSKALWKTYIKAVLQNSLFFFPTLRKTMLKIHSRCFFKGQKMNTQFQWSLCLHYIFTVLIKFHQLKTSTIFLMDSYRGCNKNKFDNRLL